MFPPSVQQKPTCFDFHDPRRKTRNPAPPNRPAGAFAIRVITVLLEGM